MIGRSIGPYQILAELGRGGMGEVYRAKDTKLNRDVAIKVLPESFALDADRVARFTREAQVLASLNHPNIAAIYGIEESGSTRALVMELVEGQDLSEILAGGPLGPRAGLPLADVLPLAKQIADALEAAHEQGVVHRDLKPANIKVRADGSVKVLDFGLAKAMDRNLNQGPQGNPGPGTWDPGPTMTSPAMTQMGMIIGTAAYMAPEQARGTVVDRRADIWAFGLVVYEMLTGRQLFPGETISDVIAAVLTKEPDLSAVPARWRRLITRCLEKDPKKRLRDIGDVWLLLDVEKTATEVAAAKPSGAVWAWALGALFIGAAAMSTVTTFMTPVVATSTVMFTEPPPGGGRFHSAPLVSPDGRRLAMIVADAAGTTRLWTRELSEATPHVIDGTNGLTSALWSPDSEQIAFVSQGSVRRVAAAGGPTSLIAPASPRSVVWLPDGDLLLAIDGQGLMRVAATGGSLRPANGFATETFRNLQFDDLQVSADGRVLLYLQFGAETGIYLSRADGSARHLVYAGAQSSPTFVGPDLIVHEDAKVLMAQRFNAKDLSLVAEAFPLGHVSNSDYVGSTSGAIAFVAGRADLSRLTWFTRDGKEAGTIGTDGEYSEVEISRGGRWVGFSRSDESGNVDLWLQPLSGGAPSRFTTDPDIDHLFTFSFDDRQVAWEAHAKGALNLMRRPADGSTPPQLVRLWGKAGGPTDWSPDGRFVLYDSQDGADGSNLWAAPVDGAAPTRLTVQGASIQQAKFSPDGRWLALVSQSTGQPEIYVQRIDGTTLVGGPVRVSENGGVSPLWRRDGSELFFNNAGAVMAVEFHGERERPASTPHQLFKIAGNATGSFGFRRSLAVMPDGQRFLALVGTTDTTPRPATVLLNWRGADGKK